MTSVRAGGHRKPFDTRLMIFFLIIWLSIFKEAREVAGNNFPSQHLTLPLCYIFLILPILLVSSYALRKFLKFNWCMRRFCGYRQLDDDLLEQRSHNPYVSNNALHSPDILEQRSHTPEVSNNNWSTSY